MASAPAPSTDGPASIAPQPSHWLWPALLAVCTITFAVLHTAILQWKSVGLTIEWPIDLCFFHNLAWNMSEGNGHIQSASYHEPPGIFGETHFEPILALAVPFYWIQPRLETLFAVQSSLLAVGSLGVYRLVRAAGGSSPAAFGGGLVYLCWWPLWRMAMADIRPLTWSIPFLLLLAAALYESKKWEAFTWGLLACLCREEVVILVVTVALAGLAWRHEGRAARKSIALRLAAAALLFFAVTSALRLNITFYIRPDEWLRDVLGGGTAERGASAWGRTPGSMLGDRLRYFSEWLLPVGLGALLAPELLVAALPLVLYLFSQAQWEALWDGPYIHHPAPAVAIVAAAAALGWPRLVRKVRAPAPVVGLVVVALLAWEGVNIRNHWQPHILPELAPWLLQDDDNFEQLDIDNRESLRERVIAARHLADQVPPDAAIVTDYDTLHLFCGREAVYCYQQMEIEQVAPPPGGLTEPLLPYSPQPEHVEEGTEPPYPVPNPPRRQPRWAVVRADHQDWLDRTQAAGMHERDRAGPWVLLGPKEQGAGSPP